MMPFNCLDEVAMIPPLKDCVKSFYFNATYAKTVNLTKLVKQNICPYEEVVKTAQKITQSKAVQDVLSQPLVYYPGEYKEKNKILEKNNFILLSTKGFVETSSSVKTPLPYYNVSEHKALDGWIIKSAARRVPEDRFLQGFEADHNEKIRFSPFESLQRLYMNKKFRNAAKRIKKVKVVIPEEYAVPFSPCHSKNINDLTQTHFIISKKLDVLTSDETIEYIKNKSEKDQVTLAKAYISLIKLGYSDSSIDNVRITKRGEWALLDTEPGGSLSGMHSIQKCKRMGLFNLYSISKQKIGSDAKFTEEIKKAYLVSLKNDISVMKVILSIIIPLIPIIICVYAYFLRRNIIKAAKVLMKQEPRVRSERESKINSLIDIELKEKSLSEEESIKKGIQIQKNADRKLYPFLNRYYQTIEGIHWKNQFFEELIS